MYPKKIKLEDKKLEKLLKEKSDLISQGRAKSEEIEMLEENMKALDEQIQEAEKKVDITDLNDEAKAISAKVDECIKEMEVIKQKIYDRMKEGISKELYDQYDALDKEKKEAEEERNKIAIKAQKYTDKIIPLGRKLMKVYLEDTYDDYDTIRIENGDIVATIFNHLEEFKKRYKENAV